MTTARQFNWGRTLRFAALLLLIVAVHSVPFALYHPGDADRFVILWYDHIIALGRIHAFAKPFSNYTPPYLYLLSAASLANGWLEPVVIIKLLSCLGAGWMAYAIARLLSAMGAPMPVEGALASLLLPSIILNVSVLGQADTFWVAPCVLAVVAGLERRLITVAVWAGVAFAFKAQAIFLAPFVVLLFLNHRARWWCWVIPAGVYALAMLPAWFQGWPALNLLTIYVRQAEWQPPDGRIFVSDSASWWTLYGFFFPELAFKTFWFGFLTAAIGAAAYIRILSRRELTPRLLLGAAALSSAGLPFLLPGMHERFFILADVLTFCLALSDPKRSTIAAAVLMQLASSVPGYGWAFGYVRLKLPACFFGLGSLLLVIEYLGAVTRKTFPATSRTKQRLAAS